MNIEVCYAGKDRIWRSAVELDAPATLGDALARSGLIERLGLDLAVLRVGLFGKLATPQTALRDGDRVELTRPLVVDPKQARRRRVEKKSAARKT